jgi:predicted phosphoadenosine phosphosulfate sulfurtransferase
MTREQAIQTAKQFRKEADELLQRMKDHNRNLGQHTDMAADDIWEAMAQHTLSIRDLESCIMRQGMALKYIGTPNPYPNSKDPSNTIVEPTADGLKL